MIRIGAAAALLTLTSATAPALAEEAKIERLVDPKPGEIILRGVKIPPNAELFFLSGLVALPIDPAKTETVEHYGDTQTQTVSTLNRIKALLEAEGYRMSDLVKLQVFLVGEERLGGRLDFVGMNAGFKQFFGTADNPNTVARSTMQVAAMTSPKYLVEIDAIAARVPGR